MAPEHHNGPKSAIYEHPRFVEGSVENKETLDAFVEQLKELQKNNPELIGATLFGSRLKGESTPDSDVDTDMYVDADVLESKGVHVGVDLKKGGVRWGDNIALAAAYRDYFGGLLADATGKDPEAIKKGLYIKPISEGIVQTQLDQLLSYTIQYEANRAWDEIEDPGDVVPPKMPDYVDVTLLNQLFRPSLIPGLEKYRAQVVDALATSGPIGEKMWQELKTGFDFGEGHFDVDDPDKYPIDVAAAQKLYASH